MTERASQKLLNHLCSYVTVLVGCRVERGAPEEQRRQTSSLRGSIIDEEEARWDGAACRRAAVRRRYITEQQDGWRRKSSSASNTLSMQRSQLGDMPSLISKPSASSETQVGSD
ncbi:hypothetical protein CRENBAI_016544 [Crenichthys baileyi]|uniref:Uncharacterized protein n=1 Tax=Crenichthys baileyi TaxID=28760 RepID=A0AAV9S703_9TELE